MFYFVTFSLLCLQDTIKQLQEELKSIEEAENLCVSFTEWLGSTQKSFTKLTDHSEPLDRATMERKMKKLEVSLNLCSHFFLMRLRCYCRLWRNRAKCAVLGLIRLTLQDAINHRSCAAGVSRTLEWAKFKVSPCISAYNTWFLLVILRMWQSESAACLDHTANLKRMSSFYRCYNKHKKALVLFVWHSFVLSALRFWWVCVCIDRLFTKTKLVLLWKRACYQGETSHRVEEDEEAPVSGACWHKHCNWCSALTASHLTHTHTHTVFSPRTLVSHDKTHPNWQRAANSKPASVMWFHTLFPLQFFYVLLHLSSLCFPHAHLRRLQYIIWWGLCSTPCLRSMLCLCVKTRDPLLPHVSFHRWR